MCSSLDPISRTLAEVQTLEAFVEIAQSGLLNASEATEWVDIQARIAKVLNRPNPFPSDEDLQRAQAAAIQLEGFAKSEKERGFPYLFGLATVRLWSMIQALVEDKALEEIARIDASGAPDALRKLKGPLLAYLNASQTEQAELLLTQLKDSLTVAFKPGVGGFESLLDVFGLGGLVADDVRRALFECSQVRNVIVHRAGIADRRLCDACPWLKLEVGSPVCVNASRFRLYVQASLWYALELNRRVYAKSGRLFPHGLTEVHDLLLQSVARMSRD
jgi:hypothetical protein